ncbi:phenylalanine ammonia-lyase [Stereum hirsutum FP-91666 SS1]|uniref:phenylalanine ammonia-lyase n=1 Tax=Stereum hirsutum (strain FP-91666) TaxID=721885 RepID=UPI000444952A|nr:phenylalanine ammonia-lyase [Stereum hirsutum FP-91666 SS1]EIM85034.1 phenylalanine ammonia-lyase [Stereum hirsutum FP-91666 SS1]
MRKFVKQYNELQNYKNGDNITLDGHSLSISAVVAVARCHATVTLSDATSVKDRVQKSRKVVEDKVAGEMSVYGVSTGFGGSADTRTANTLALGSALLQHQHAGVLPSSTSSPLPVLPLSDPLTSTSMPESWVRGALLIRMNSLIRGHSGVRFELIEKMSEFLQANIIPMIPLRGSISASGDLQPLSYIAGAISGNPSIRCFDGPAMFGARQIVSSRDALAKHGIEPINLAAKEHLGILNGTAFSASVAALALNDAVHMGMLAQVCTAMGTEALLGVRGNYHPFISETARPHPGQIEVSHTIWDLLEGSKLALTHETEVTIEEDDGELRQDRYPLRTTPQFLGPQIEDLLSSLETITLECNSTTDNPLFDGETGEVHHGGNFQAMAVTNVMEKTRLSLHHIGKLMFAQATELINPMMNRGLPSCLAATDPSLNYHAKGLDIASASYVSELGYLANPVSTHIQSAEMHNQAVNSLALISGRATITALEVLSLLISTYLYLLCQALDIRALQLDFRRGLTQIVEEEVQSHFGAQLASSDISSMRKQLVASVYKTLDATSSVDAPARMEKVAAASSSALVDHFVTVDASALSALPAYREAVARRATFLINELRDDYLSGKKGPAPASAYLHKTRPVYEFVRIGLGVRMHGSENQNVFANGLGVEEVTIGQNVSLIHEAIRDGKMQGVVAGLFA